MTRPDPALAGMTHKKPDFIFFMVDQLSQRWLEAAGWASICPTPNLDRLGKRGVTFSNAITSNPVCQPARATIATGLSSRGHGVLQNGYGLDPGLTTFMQSLQLNGWFTGAFGKVHFLPHYQGLRPDYRPYGFDVVHNTEDPRGGEWLDWVERARPEHYPAALATVWPTRLPEFAAYGPRQINLRERIEEIRKTFRWATPEFPRNTAAAYTLPFPEELSQTAWITSHAIEFIRQMPAGQPICAHISYVQPHGPSCPPAEYMARVNAEDIPEPAPAEWLTDPHAPRYFRGKRPSSADWRLRRHYYFADIAHLDHQLGRVMNALAEAGRLDNAYVFFLADHGDNLGDHGFYGKEERHYDACIRVPLIVAGPGLRQGLTRDDMVQLEDLCPTVLEAARLPQPRFEIGPYLKADPAQTPTLPGRSLLALCRGEEIHNWREAAYCESYNAIWSIDPMDWARTIRTRDVRYTFYPRGGGEQLFLLGEDPGEQRNLATDPRYSALRQTLRDHLLEQIVMQDYPLTRRELKIMGAH